MVVALLIAAAAMQPVPGDPVEDACYAADYSQQSMNRCAGEAFQRADAELNAQWQKVMGTYGDDAEAKALLLEGQRAWLTYRETWCKIAAFDSIGGSIWLLINSGCLATLTRARVTELKALFEGEQ